MIDDGEFAGVPIGGLGHGEHRAHVPRRRRALAPRGRPASPRAGRRGRLLDLRRRSRRARRATVLSALRPTDLPGVGLGPAGRRRHVPRACSRGPGRRSSPTSSASALSASSCRRSSPATSTRSALPVGAFEWWVENPGPDPLTVGLMFTWADPPGGRRGRPLRDPTTSSATADVGRGPLRRLREPTHRPGCAGRSRSRARGGDGVDAERAGRRSTRSPTRRSGPTSPPTAGSTPAPPASAATAPRPGRRARPSPRPSILAPGERRSIRFALAWDLPMVEFGAGPSLVEALHPRLGPERHCGPGTWPCTPSTRCPTWRRPIEAWQAPILDDPERPAWYKMALFNELYFLVDGGTFWEHGEVGGPEPPADDVGRFALLECLDYPFYDTVDVDFYASFAILELFPELELARDPRPARGDPGRRPGDRDDRGVRARGAAQGRWHRARTTSADPTTTRSTARTGTASRTSAAGRTSVPSSCSRRGATPSPPVRTATRSSARSGRPSTTS